jgi:hypothetical protein
MAEKSGPEQGNPNEKKQPIEVDELDDKNLEGASGGFIAPDLADNNDHCTVNNAANC